MPSRSLITHVEPVQVVQARASKAVAQRAALAFAERALRAGLPAGLRAMRGRAILADEVGLGKTIEAALVASELRLRGLAAQTLILVPVGLVEQWQEELDRKFGLPSVLAQRSGFQHATRAAEQPLVIAPLTSA